MNGLKEIINKINNIKQRNKNAAKGNLLQVLLMIERASLAIFFAVICVSTNHSDQTESDIPIKSACKDRAKCMLLYLTG